MKISAFIYITARIVAAVIMLQTLYFKFTAAEESVYIFSKLGVEPWGRIATGVIELVAAGLLLFNLTAWIGAMVSIVLMAGAIFAHLIFIGIVVNDDGGYLFFLAFVVLFCGIVVLYRDKGKLLRFKDFYGRRS